MSLDALSRYDDAEDEIKDEDHNLILKTRTPDSLTQGRPSSQPTSDVESNKPKSLVSYIGGEYSDDEDSNSESGDTDADVGTAKPSIVNLGLYETANALSSVESNSPNSITTTVPSEQAETTKENSDGVRLPPEPEGRCSKSLQEKVAKMMAKKNSGMNVNEYVQRKKEFRNPSIYEKLVSFIGIDEHGTNFPKHLYDPTIWGPESFYEALSKTQKEHHEKKEKEKMKRSHVEFVTGTKKLPTSQDKPAATTEKKSKWDQGPGAK